MEHLREKQVLYQFCYDPYNFPIMKIFMCGPPLSLSDLSCTLSGGLLYEKTSPSFTLLKHGHMSLQAWYLGQMILWSWKQKEVRGVMKLGAYYQTIYRPILLTFFWIHSNNWPQHVAVNHRGILWYLKMIKFDLSNYT